MAKLISRTYGEALFELAVEEHLEDALLEEAQTLIQVFADNPDLSRVMKHPKIVREEKISTLEAVFRGRINDKLLGFLILMIEKDRYDGAESALTYFIEKMKEYRGIGIASVKTAVSLTNEQKKQVEARLLATTGYRTMEVHYEVEKDLIGGMVIRIGDRVVDSSIRTKLNEMERDLMKIQLA